MSASMNIFIMSHKQSTFPSVPEYVPLHVGKALSMSDFAITGDDTGDNISALNPFFCELTGLYWLWKNSKSISVGLVHYRRYFAGKSHSIEFAGKAIASALDFEEIEKKTDLIILEPIRLRSHITNQILTNEEQYSECTIGLDLALAREAVNVIDPSYTGYWDFVMRSTLCSICNMMVGKKHVVDSYCEWLFEVLFLLEKWIPYREYNTFDRRVFGFLAERLLNVWIAKNRKNLVMAYRQLVSIP